MERNLDRRVEVLCPIADTSLRTYLRQVLEAYLQDSERAWTLDVSGRYKPPPGDASEPRNAQQFLLNRHTVEYQRDELLRRESVHDWPRYNVIARFMFSQSAVLSDGQSFRLRTSVFHE